MTYKPRKIISGGQTGADTGGLIAASKLGIATGGCAPRGYKTEAGEQAETLKAFGLLEHSSSNYRQRTKQNVIDSDATLILATDPGSDGTKLTIQYCEAFEKPYLVIQPSDASIAQIQKFIDDQRPSVLNIAGNRESKSKGITARTEAILRALFE